LLAVGEQTNMFQVFLKDDNYIFNKMHQVF